MILIFLALVFGMKLSKIGHECGYKALILPWTRFNKQTWTDLHVPANSRHWETVALAIVKVPVNWFFSRKLCIVMRVQPNRKGYHKG